MEYIILIILVIIAIIIIVNIIKFFIFAIPYIGEFFVFVFSNIGRFFVFAFSNIGRFFVFVFSNFLVQILVTIGIIAAVILFVLIFKKVYKRVSIIVSKMKTKFTCPYCYEEHDITNCGLKCSYHTVGKTYKKCKFNVIKYPNKYGKDWIPDKNKNKCLKCKEAAKQLFCNETNKQIPIEFLSMKNLPVALLGAKASGKSNYIGVLIDEIQKKMSNPFNCALSLTSSRDTKQAYEDLYYRPLYKDGYTVKATDFGEVPPLIFPLRFMDAKNKIINTAILTFYDTAGENLDDENAIHTFNGYIMNANGIIMLLDPLQILSIREKLKNNGFKDLPAKNTSIYTVLSTVIDVIRSVKNIKEQIPIPLALVVTKIDVLEKYNLLPSVSCLREESEHIKRGVFFKRDCENTNIQVKDLLDNLLDADLFSYIRQFKMYSFFGVTALGQNPTNGGTKIVSENINPRRVLDPLLWLLAVNRYIRTLRK